MTGFDLTYRILEIKLWQLFGTETRLFVSKVIRPNEFKKKPKKIGFYLSGDRFAFVRVNDLVKIKRKIELRTVLKERRVGRMSSEEVLMEMRKQTAKMENSEEFRNVNG